MTTPRRINADVFRRARREGATLDIAAYVARPAALDLEWLSHYQSDGEWADFEIAGRRFRVTARDPQVIEGDCTSCRELVNAYNERDEGIAWMTPDEFDRTDHRALTVELLDDDGEPTDHEASLWGTCGRTDTYVDRLTDERYVAETVVELATEALASEANDAEIARNAEEIRTHRRDAERAGMLDRIVMGAELLRIGQTTPERFRHGVAVTLGWETDDEPATLTFHSTITGEEGPVTMTVNPEITPRGWSPQG